MSVSISVHATVGSAISWAASNPQPFEGAEPDRHGLNLPFLFVIFQGDVHNASHVRPDCFKLDEKEIQQLTLRLNSLELRIAGNEEGSLGSQGDG